MRGLMLDAARLVEKVEYYRRFIDFCAAWEVNTILFRLADDEGSVLRFQSHPQLMTHPHSLTAEQLRELALYAQEKGIELIPEVESFGHTSFITASPQYAELSDAGEESSEFNGLCPVHPKTLSLMGDLYREVAEIFPSRYLHAGCDEVHWGGSQRSKQALQQKPRHVIWAEYLNSLHEMVVGLGKQMMVWGDHVLRKESDALPLLDKRIILVDWDYWTTRSEDLGKYAQKAIDAGHQVIGAPATHWCAWGPRPGTTQLANIDAFVDAYRRQQDPAALGVIVTTWCPQRYLSNGIWDTLAYAAAAMNLEPSLRRPEIFARFVQRHFQADWSRAWDQALHGLYDLMPWRKNCMPRELRSEILSVPWHSDGTLRALLQRGRRAGHGFCRLLDDMEACRALVRQNHDDFEALVLQVRYLKHLDWREAALVEGVINSPTDEQLRHLMQTIAQQDAEMVAALQADWRKVRPGASVIEELPARTEVGSNVLLLTMQEAARYSASLRDDVHHLRGLLKVS